MPGGKQLHLRTGRTTKCRDKRHKSALANILRERRVDALHGGHQTMFRREDCPRIGATKGGKERWADPVPCNVPECDEQLPIRKHLPIIIIAASVIRSLIPAGNFKALNFWGPGGE